MEIYPDMLKSPARKVQPSTLGFVPHLSAVAFHKQRWRTKDDVKQQGQTAPKTKFPV